MKKTIVLAGLFLACACAGLAQLGRTTDWWSYGGDAQRTGWEKSDSKFTKADVRNFQLLWKMNLDNEAKGAGSLLPPVILGNLIGYRGFKELAFVAGSSDNLWVIDADLARMYWSKHFDTSESSKDSTCAGGLTAMPTLPAPLTFRFSAPAKRDKPASSSAAPPAAAGGARNPDGSARPGGANPAPATQRKTPPAVDPMKAFFSPKPVYVLSSDGKLHRLNQQDGADVRPPENFVPAGARARSLNIGDDVIYTTTSEGCGDSPNAVWGLDLNDTEAKPASFVSKGASLEGLGGPALGTDGTVYVQTGNGEFDPPSGKYANTLLALTAKNLQVKDYFILPESGSAKKDSDMNVTTPVLFAYKGRDLAVTAGKDGRLYLLDSKSLGGSDHKSFLSRTPPLSAGESKSAEHGIWGSLSSWENTDGTRYVAAAVWGPLASDLKADTANGDVTRGAIAAFKLHDQGGKPTLTVAWVSRDLSSPAPPVIAQGVVFALANGEFSRKVKESKGVVKIQDHPKGSTHATLYALDGLSGKEIYSTGDQVTSPGSLTGLSVANSRVYFTTTDNTIYVFGKYLEH